MKAISSLGNFVCSVGSCLLFTITDSWAAANIGDALSPFHGIAFTTMAAVIIAGFNSRSKIRKTKFC